MGASLFILSCSCHDTSAQDYEEAYPSCRHPDANPRDSVVVVVVGQGAAWEELVESGCLVENCDRACGVFVLFLFFHGQVRWSDTFVRETESS